MLIRAGGCWTMEELVVGRGCQCLNRCQELVRSGEEIPKIQVIK
jgi:hypothetical protein